MAATAAAEAGAVRATPAAVTAAALVTVPRAARSPAWAASVFQTARPRQWPKNLLIFAAPLAGATWGRPDGAFYALVAAVAFCCASVAVYFINDVADAERDRRHPRKRFRPVAAGDLPRSHALAVGVACAAAGLGAFGVAIAKRYTELAGLGPAAIGHRPALRRYRPRPLLAAQWVVGAAMIAAYVTWAAGERSGAQGWHLVSAIPLATALIWFGVLTARHTSAPVEDLLTRNGVMLTSELAWLACS